MSLGFPAFEEIPLENSPLAEVIFQVRYPAIWSIGDARPSAFQDRIRHLFPEPDEEQSFHLNIDANRLQGAPQIDLSSDRAYLFYSEDRLSTLSLDSQAVSVSTRNYTAWKDFSSVLSLVLDSIIDIYKIPYARRIGLRFINVLDTKSLDFTSLDEVKNLLRPELLALYSTDAWQSPKELVSTVFLSDDALNLMIRTALTGSPEEQNSILLDLDCFEEGTIHYDNVNIRIAQYHDLIYRAFRWALSEGAVEKFAPKSSGPVSSTS